MPPASQPVARMKLRGRVCAVSQDGNLFYRFTRGEVLLLLLLEFDAEQKPWCFYYRDRCHCSHCTDTATTLAVAAHASRTTTTTATITMSRFLLCTAYSLGSDVLDVVAVGIPLLLSMLMLTAPLQLSQL